VKRGFLRGKTHNVFPLKQRFGYIIVGNKVTRGGIEKIRRRKAVRKGRRNAPKRKAMTSSTYANIQKFINEKNK